MIPLWNLLDSKFNPNSHILDQYKFNSHCFHHQGQQIYWARVALYIYLILIAHVVKRRNECLETFSPSQSSGDVETRNLNLIINMYNKFNFI